ncbi:MAG TPA: response regulator transcription factor [Zeimonas sp.]
MNGPMDTIRVLLADDHPVLRDGLQALLERDPSLHVVAQAADGREAVQAAIGADADVVVMDLSMPGLDGIDAMRELARRHPRAKVVVLSMHASPEHVWRALQAGASAYVVKDAAAREVVDAVHAAHEGRRHLSPRIADAVVEGWLHPARSRGPIETLSRRERQILELVAQGGSSIAIARALNLSPKTVDTYRARLMRKLNVANVAGLVRVAIACGVIASG